MKKELTGKIALVTGGTKGIGKAIADKLSEAGALVIVTARNHPGDGNLKHHFVAADMTVAGEAEKMAGAINNKYGTIDILVNNMGGSNSPSGGFGVLTDEHWESDLQLNLNSAVRLDRAILPILVAKKGGVLSIFLQLLVPCRYTNRWVLMLLPKPPLTTTVKAFRKSLHPKAYAWQQFHREW